MTELPVAPMGEGGMTDLKTQAARIHAAYRAHGQDKAAEVLGEVIAAETTLLCAVLADIRIATGVNEKPMLGELAGAIKAKITERERLAKLDAYREANLIWQSVQHSPAPWVDGREKLRKLMERAKG